MLPEKLERAREKYSPWHWYPCFPSTPLSDGKEACQPCWVEWHQRAAWPHVIAQMCYSPNKISAMRAVCRLSQVGGHELVPVDLMDPSSDGPLPPARADSLAEHSLFILICTWGWSKKATLFKKHSLAKLKWHVFMLSGLLSKLRHQFSLHTYTECVEKDHLHHVATGV